MTALIVTLFVFSFVACNIGNAQKFARVQRAAAQELKPLLAAAAARRHMGKL